MEYDIRPMRLNIVDAERCVGCQLCMFACVRRGGKGGLLDSSILIRSIGGLERGFRVLVCRACPDPPCAKVCPTDALKILKNGGVKLNSEKCIGCGNCVDGCTLNAVFWNHEKNKPVICVYCGYCANYCPHGVIAHSKESVGDEA